MIQHFLITTFHVLVRSKFYAAINIIGLTVGLATAILLMLFVRDELTYDTFFPADVYRIASTIKMPGGKLFKFDATDYAAAKAMVLDYPGIQSIARMMPEGWSVRRGQIESNETIYWSDPSIFTVLPLHAIAGDLQTALERADAVVLTRAMARKYFGQDAPLGQILRLGRKYDMRVAAVVDDLPSNTHLSAQIFGSGRAAFSNLHQMDGKPAGVFHFDSTTFTYFRLKPGVSLAPIRASLPNFVIQRLHLPVPNAFGVVITLSILPVRAIHFSPAGVNAMKPPGDLQTIYGATAIAFLILFAACINFVNLTTARLSRRTLEVGIRKAAGGSRAVLIGQFIGEAMVQVGIAMVLALALAELLLPLFNGFLRREIVFAYWRPEAAASLLLTAMIVSLASGIYPAHLISATQPASALKGEARLLTPGALRKGLVVAQFAILTGLLLSTLVIWRQTEFAVASATNFDSSRTLLIPGPCTDSFKDGLAALSGVQKVACSQPMMINSGGLLNAQGGVEIMEMSPSSMHSFGITAVDFGFLELYGLKPLAGRLFDQAQAGDILPPSAQRVQPQEERIVINETGMHDLGLRQPGDAIGLRLQASEERGRKYFTIIGVVPDFPIQSVQVPRAPVAYFVDHTQMGMLNVEVASGQMASVNAGIRDFWNATSQLGLLSIIPLSLYTTSLYEDIQRQGVVFAIAALVALFIACLGLSAMASFIAEQRTREIGVRKAMGARTADILGMLLWQFVRPVLWANLIAWPLAWWAMHSWLAGFASHIPLQFWMFGAASTLTFAIALLTVAGHAILVARQKPVLALRYE